MALFCVFLTSVSLFLKVFTLKTPFCLKKYCPILKRLSVGFLKYEK